MYLRLTEDSMADHCFLHDWPWISLWIKSISYESDITIHVITSQLSGHCHVISNRLWRHQLNENQVIETRGLCVKLFVFIVIYGFVCHVRNEIMYVLSWRTVIVLTQVLYWYLLPSSLGNAGNKTKITLSWGLNWFVTRVHTLFSMYKVELDGDNIHIST